MIPLIRVVHPEGKHERKNRYIGDNYDHTFALIAALDLVIAVNTTAVHACGAMGKECWTLTPGGCAWRYGLEGDQMPMYGSVRQIRQAGRKWPAVLREVANDYEGYCDNSRTRAVDDAEVLGPVD